VATIAVAMSDEFVESCNPDGCANCSTLGHYCAARGITITCAEIVSMDGFDATDRPVAGTECAGCRHLGHFCQAKGMCGEQALCLACGTGKSCDQVRSIEKMHAGVGQFEEFEAEHAPAVCRTIEITDADRVVTETAPVTAWAIKASLDPENLKRIGVRKTNLRWSNGSPRPKRVKVVKEGVLTGSKGKKPASKKKPAATAKKASAAPSPEKAATVAVHVTERDLDTFWSHCTLAEKAIAFTAVLEGR